MRIFLNHHDEFVQMHEKETAALNRLIELQAGIIAEKEQEVNQLKFEVIQLKDQLAQSANQTQDPNLQPIFPRHEPWTLKRQRLEMQDRQSPEVIAERMRLEQHWKKRNEAILKSEEENAQQGRNA